MPKNVLLVYATKYGSTKEIAEAIGKTLEESGLAVDVKPVGDATSIAGYDAVVLGSALYIGKFMKDAKRFLETNQEELAKMPVAVFASGPMSAEEDMSEVDKQLEANLALVPSIKPIATKVFIGAYDPGKLRFPDTLVAKLPVSPLKGAPAKDERDWDAIRAWAKEVADKLK